VVSIARELSTWRVDVVTADGIEHEMDVALNGRRLVSEPRVEADDVEDRGEQQQVAQAARLGHLAAVRAALANTPGQVVDLELSSDDGRMEWEVQLIDDQQLQRSITVDSVSGDVLHNELDD